MSLSLLLTQNNLGPFFLGSSAVTSTYTNYIDTLLSSPAQTLQIGTVNATTLKFGNSAHSTSCDFSSSASITLPQASLSPYIINNSGVEVSKNVNLSGAVSTGAAACRFRRIGEWVDLFVSFNSTSVGVTNTSPITLASVLSVGYLPTIANISIIIEVVDSGASPTVVAGNATIDTSGNINIQRLGPTNWTGGANWGFNSFCVSFPVV